MNVVIFSKDRAAQLDLLLRSMPEWFDEVYVIWTASDNNYRNAYQVLMNETPECVMCIQQGKDFKQDTVWFADSPNEHTMFLTDDDVFLRGFDMPTMPDNVACLSLRLNPRMDYCYTLNRPQKMPKIGTAGNIWNWRLADADYGYPMSLDGHIFRTADILPLLERLDYHDPNSLEAALARNPINRPMMMCFDRSVIVNNPVNRVQDTIKNRFGEFFGYSQEWLNKQFMAGKRIKLEPFIGYDPNACHVELPIIME